MADINVNSYNSGGPMFSIKYLEDGKKIYCCLFCRYSTPIKAFEEGISFFVMQDEYGIKIYYCSNCSYSSQYKHCLKRHFDLHTGKKPYKCDSCGKSFAQNSGLYQHKKTHSKNE
ncbi:hypothetical protein CDAR_261951 [Caerostris darwini]|uniref:C2H2-type domain-containing protein n=1 Tax=Caerostris darwini TaxID=1538125 RepID=A0AAV4WZG4_9ARAC|nr:hypothetical protein CDAR_261951 [Caerostris darwini]